MGSSISRVGSSSSSSRRPSSSDSPSRLIRTKRKLSSLLCGSPASHSPLEIEDHPHGLPINSENLAPAHDGSPNSTAGSCSAFGSESGHPFSKLETGTSSESNSSDIVDESYVGYNMINLEASSNQIRLSKNKEVVLHQPSQELVSSDARDHMVAPVDSHDSSKQGVSLSYSGDEQTSRVIQDCRNSRPDGNSFEDDGNAVTNSTSSDSGILSVASNSLAQPLPRDDNPWVATPSRPGFLWSNTEDDLGTGDVLHFDVVSISSNILSSNNAEMSYREARRNSRRLFWDALSRRSFRRRSGSPTIVFATGNADDLGSHDRWLLDLSGDLHYDGVGHDSTYLGARTRRRNDRRWLLRSEISEGVASGPDGTDRRAALCSSGLHPDGTCSCEPFFMDDEFINLARISRIIMLAEALFEVLDEIHRQPFSLSLSLPAPESVVDSFPLKYHKISEGSGPSDVQQCYICLGDYEEGEELRVLPCHHEYHKTCIDKWLKEINRVCPVCRGNVCEASGQSSDAITETPSQL